MDGSKYEGRFHNGKFEGEGKRHSASGDLIEQGVYENGKFKPVEVKKTKPTVSLKDFFAEFKSKFGYVQVGNTKIYFDYRVGSEPTTFSDGTVIMMTDLSQGNCMAYTDLYNKNHEQLKESLTNFADEVKKFSLSKGYNKVAQQNSNCIFNFLWIYKYILIRDWLIQVEL